MKKSSLLNICKFFFLIFSCFSLETFAQTEKEQSYLHILSFDQLDSLFIYSQHDDFSTLELYAQRMLTISRKNDSVLQKNIAFYNLAFAYHKQGKKNNYNQAIDSLEYYTTQSKDITMLANCFNLRGTIAYEEGNLETAFSEYTKVIEISTSPKNQRMTLVALNNIALIKKELQTPKEALKDVCVALKGFRKDNRFYNEIGSMHLIGELYLDMYRLHGDSKYLDSTKLYTDSGLKKCKLYKDTFGHYLFLYTKGQWLQETKQYDKALVTLEESLNYFEENNDQKWKLFLYLYLGRLHDETQNHTAAIEVLEKASSILATKDFHFSDTPEVYLLLTKNYFYVQNHAKANTYLEKYKSFSGKIEQDNRKLFAKLHNEYNVTALEKKISQIEIKASHKQYVILLITITSIIVIGLIALFFYRKNRTNSKRLTEILDQLETTEIQKEVVYTTTNAKIEDTEIQRILHSLETLEKEEYYLAMSCTLNSVAKEIDTNTSYLSKIVNEYKGKSFANYLNEYRINKVLVKLKSDSQYHQYTLKYIAEQFGFSRHETFSRVFKKQTGISPSYYLKKLKNDNL
ncbi:helix-turn-helix domain-containing protein [uncultured Kordia sp.]|uniref:helix-turn-helix domain-containing protein n=1 Tax=uncultured Kordia sp. TaxID=507699 RepID=UPI002621C6D2|nr:helix-turn-helix domain-containing protein [uncultured Kordia sp.]